MTKPIKPNDNSDDQVIIIDPNNTYIDSSVKLGKGCVIEPFSFLKGNTQIGDYSNIGPNAYIENTIIGSNCKIDYSKCVDSNIDSNVQIGPYSRIRDNSYIASDVYIGNFVEIKNSTIEKNSFITHFAYLGDATIGADVNIGAGTVTCNYDGKTKNRTVIGDNCFIGSGTMLIAPVEIGAKSVTGAGSVVTTNVKEGTTVIGNPARKLK